MGKNNRQRRRMKAKSRRAAGSAFGFAPAGGDSWSSSPVGGGVPSADQLLRVRVAEFVSRALQAYVGRRAHEFDSAVAMLVGVSGAAGGRRAVARTLVPMLREALSECWQHGWQPIDLHRLAGRRLSAGEQLVLGDAMAEELSRYASATVDPRWSAQLQELDARTWWPQARSYLEARGESGAAEWLAVTERALKVLALLSSVPKLEMLGPAPGTALPSTGPGAPEVDDRILSRVRALLAKAESTTFEAEAETFTAGAQALMARHSIDAALLAAVGGQRQGRPGGRRIGIDNPYEAPKAMLLTAVADANRCRTVWSRELGFTTVVGYASDLDAVETLFTSLLVQATRAMTREGSRTDRQGRSRTRNFRQSFLSAFASRIGERLAEVTESETRAAATDLSHSGGRELVPLLAARSAVVDEEVEAMFPDVVMHSMRMGSDAEGWHSGRSAADQAALTGDVAVEQREATA
jgi:hypothetical protein